MEVLINRTDENALREELSLNSLVSSIKRLNSTIEHEVSKGTDDDSDV